MATPDFILVMWASPPVETDWQESFPAHAGHTITPLAGVSIDELAHCSCGSLLRLKYKVRRILPWVGAKKRRPVYAPEAQEIRGAGQQ